MTMFAYNNNVHSSINQFFHQLLKNYIVILINVSKNAIESEAPMTTKRAEWLRISRKYFINMWKKVANTQIKYYDARHVAMCFKIDDKIFLKNINIKTLRSKKKFKNKQLESFIIEKKIDTQAYKFMLLKKYDVIYLIFHVFLLESWHAWGDDSEFQPIFINDEKKWKIDEILDKKITHDKTKYLVKWTNTQLWKSNWKFQLNLINAKKAIKTYEKNHDQSRKKNDFQKKINYCFC